MKHYEGGDYSILLRQQHRCRRPVRLGDDPDAPDGGLVGNSPERGSTPVRPFLRQIEQEEYRQWLVELLRPHQVILITARPERYREVTLERIAAQTGWQPMDAYFAQISARPPQIKEHLLRTYIFPKYGERGYFGLESNPHTRAMYAKYGISALRVTAQELIMLPR